MAHSKQIRERAIEYVRGGMSYYSAAQTLTAQIGVKVHKDSVRDWCRKAGVTSGHDAVVEATAEARRKAVELVRGGASQNEAARQTGVASISVSRWCRREGIQSHVGQGRPASPEKREMALEMVRNGATLTEAARQAGVCAATVWRWCLAAGVKSRNDKSGNKVVRKATPVSADRIRAALEQLKADKEKAERKAQRKVDREKRREDLHRIRETLRSWHLPRENNIRATKSKGDKSK